MVDEKTRLCKDCKHMQRSWNPFEWITKYQRYRCTFDGKSESQCPVTGKVKITLVSVSCVNSREIGGRCEPRGRNWEPSDRFLNKKENLFKLIADPNTFSNQDSEKK